MNSLFLTLGVILAVPFLVLIVICFLPSAALGGLEKKFLNKKEGKLEVKDKVTAEIHQLDLSDLPAENIESAVAEILTADFIKPFDLARASIFRATIIRRNSSHIQVALTSHLTVCDGWSLDVLVQELGKIYTALIKKEKPALDNAASFVDYLRQQHLEQRVIAEACAALVDVDQGIDRDGQAEQGTDRDHKGTQQIGDQGDAVGGGPAAHLPGDGPVLPDRGEQAGRNL